MKVSVSKVKYVKRIVGGKIHKEKAYADLQNVQHNGQQKGQQVLKGDNDDTADAVFLNLEKLDQGKADVSIQIIRETIKKH